LRFRGNIELLRNLILTKFAASFDVDLILRKADVCYAFAVAVDKLDYSFPNQNSYSFVVKA